MWFLNESFSYDDSTMLALGHAFDAVMTTLRSYDPLHDWDGDVGRRTQLAQILFELAATGITDPYVLRSHALDRLPLPPQNETKSVRRTA